MKSQKKVNTKVFGTLYHHSMGKSSGSIVITPRSLNKKDKVRRTVGAGLASLSMALYIYSYGPIIKDQLAQEVKPQASQVVAAVSSTPAPQQTTETVSVLINEEEQTPFSIYIPDLNTRSEVFVNINPFDQDNYNDVLTRGVAQAQGTGLPGEGSRIFLFAHSTNSLLNFARYNAVFYDIGSLKKEALIELAYKGNIHKYSVTDTKIVPASAVEWLAPHEGEELILQTCWPRGTSWRRLLVFAKPVNN